MNHLGAGNETPINIHRHTPDQTEMHRDQPQGIHRQPIRNATACETAHGLEDRAAHMNDFWRALVEFQDRDVLVVALCVGG